MISRSPEETISIGEVIGEKLEPGDVIALIGELGAGKTCLTQGLAHGLGVGARWRITSPTFTLINEYPGRVPVVHMDIYRLSGAGDLAEMGYEEYFFGGNVVIIEWAEKIREILPEHTIYLEIDYVDETSRAIRISGKPERSEKIISALKERGLQ